MRVCVCGEFVCFVIVCVCLCVSVCLFAVFVSVCVCLWYVSEVCVVCVVSVW